MNGGGNHDASSEIFIFMGTDYFFTAYRRRNGYRTVRCTQHAEYESFDLEGISSLGPG
jgi:hypothetical protein